MDIRLFATDLDGTLLGSDGAVSRRNFTTMRRACTDGCFVVPTTGRSFFEMPRALRTSRGCYTHCICSDGAAIYDYKGDILWKSVFPSDAVRHILEVLRSYDVLLELYVDGVPYARADQLNEKAYRHYRIEPEYDAVMDETRHGVVDPAAFAEQHIDNVELMNVFFADEGERTEAFARLAHGGIAELTTSMQSNLEILQPGINKGSALTKLCKMLGVRREQTLAVGDSRNDLSMFRAVGVGLAVSGACNALKEKATAVICSNDAHTFAYAYSHYKPQNRTDLKTEGTAWTKQRRLARSIF